MKMKMLYMGFAVLIVAASVVYARSGRSSVFTFAVHPLAAYADQLPSDSAPESAVAEIGLEAAPASLLDGPGN